MVATVPVFAGIAALLGSAGWMWKIYNNLNKETVTGCTIELTPKIKKIFGETYKKYMIDSTLSIDDYIEYQEFAIRLTELQ